MIKLFQKIRQGLISDKPPSSTAGRFSKYLLYAVGEIILVVIGIMIALSLNNWNAQQKDQELELRLLAEMRQNLETDLGDCRYNISFTERMIRGCSAVLKHLEAQTPFHDSLKVHYGNLMGSTVLTANTSAFDNLKSIGFVLIRNDELRKHITKLYSERYPYLNKVESGYYEHLQMEDIGPQLYEKIVTDTLWGSAYPIDLEALRKDNYFKGVIRMNIFTCGYMITLYKGFEDQIRELIEQIDAELEARMKG